MNASRETSQRDKLLRIYLNDHLMGAAGGTELARRALRNNRGTPLGAFLSDLVTEITQDRVALEALMDDLGLAKDRAKMVAAVVAERVGRLKLNGSLWSYSNLSRLIELEGLATGVSMKLLMWKSLQHIATTDERLAHMDFERLIERASSQTAELERHRLEAAQRAFAAGAGASG